MIKLHWVTGSSVLSLFSELCLSNGLRNILAVCIWPTYLLHCVGAILCWVEKLCRHHHLLICIWCLSLIYKIKIRILTISISYRRTDPAAITKTIISIRLHNLIDVILLGIGTELLLSSIASLHLIHEISVNHCVSHLNLIILRKFATISCGLETTNFRLIEHIRFSTLNSWKHIVDSWIVGWLKHLTIVRCIHFIDRQRSIIVCTRTTLLSNSISHKESLILLIARPKKKNKVDKMIQKFTYIPCTLLVGDWL